MGDRSCEQSDLVVPAANPEAIDAVDSTAPLIEPDTVADTDQVILEIAGKEPVENQSAPDVVVASSESPADVEIRESQPPADNTVAIEPSSMEKAVEGSREAGQRD